MNLFDNHNHSEFSFDCHGSSVELSAKAAIEAGLAGITFTDHYDLKSPGMIANGLTRDETFDINGQQAQIDKMRKEEWCQGFKIMKGIELGLNKDCHEGLRMTLKENNFDEVIASLHYIDSTDPYHRHYYIGKGFREAYGHYLETINEEIHWLEDFDILGHFDYIVRYPDYPEVSILYRDFPDVLDEILRYLAYEGKALEINTKTYQDYHGRTPVLDLNILKRYQEFGGEAISLGSDSHSPDKVSCGFKRTAAFLREQGFRYLAHFENRKLIMLPND